MEPEEKKKGTEVEEKTEVINHPPLPPGTPGVLDWNQILNGPC